MSDNNNYYGEEAQGNIEGYGEENYQANSYPVRGTDFGPNPGPNPGQGTGPGSGYRRNIDRNVPGGSRMPRTNESSNYQGSDRRLQDRYYPQNRMYYGGYRPEYENPNDRRDMRYSQAHYRGDDRMYRGYYQVRDDYYPCPIPYYNHDYDDDDYYDDDRYNYKGYRYHRGYRRGRPYCPGWYEPYYMQGMRRGPWWNPHMISDFIERPPVNNFLRGVGIATVGMILAPSVARTLRPVLVKAVQGAMTASDEVKGIFVDAKEDIEDIFAEAKWERNRHERDHRGKPETQEE